MSECALPCCIKPGTSGCSICLKVAYCSGDCQKTDWKEHKIICKTLKKLSCQQLQSYNEASQVIAETLSATDKISKSKRVLGHLLSYAEFHFGERSPGKTYRERGNDRMKNWIVEIEILLKICQTFIDIHDQDESFSIKIQNDRMCPLVQRSLELLKPWSSEDASRIERLSIEQMDYISAVLSRSEGKMASIHTSRAQFNLSENFCQRAITSAKRYKREGETKSMLLYEAFRMFCDLRIRQHNDIEAASLAEEAYNCVAVAYNPVHLNVQDAGNNLIECFLKIGKFYDAERFAEMNLDSLKDPANGVNQLSEEVAKGYFNLGNVILKQDGDLAEAEKLLREAYRIGVQLPGKDRMCVGLTANILAQLLRKQENLGEETKKYLEQFLAISIRHEGMYGVNTAIANGELGNFYEQVAAKQLNVDARRKYLRLALSCHTAALDTTTKIYGSAHENSVKHARAVSFVTTELSGI